MNAQPRIRTDAVAHILGVSKRTVQEMSLRGELPGAARIGGVWTFDGERLAAFVKRRERDAERPAALGPKPKQPRRATLAQTNAAYARVMAGRFDRRAAY
jgi:hypothetical protein